MSGFFNVLQIIIGLGIILVLVVWTSVKHEGKKWGPSHKKLCELVFELVKNEQCFYILDEFKTRIWSGSKTETGASLRGFVPIGIYLDTAFRDLLRLEQILLKANKKLQATEAIELEVAEILIREIKNEFINPEQQELADEDIFDEPPEGELRIDISEKMLRQFVAAHLVHMLKKSGQMPSAVEEDPQIFAGRIRTNMKTERMFLVRLEVPNDIELAEQLEKRIAYTFGSHWNVAFYK